MYTYIYIYIYIHIYIYIYVYIYIYIWGWSAAPQMSLMIARLRREALDEAAALPPRALSAPGKSSMNITL